MTRCQHLIVLESECFTFLASSETRGPLKANRPWQFMSWPGRDDPGIRVGGENSWKDQAIPPHSQLSPLSSQQQTTMEPPSLTRKHGIAWRATLRLELNIMDAAAPLLTGLLVNRRTEDCLCLSISERVVRWGRSVAHCFVSLSLTNG